jgi:methyl-accepting chemotaxis protein
LTEINDIARAKADNELLKPAQRRSQQHSNRPCGLQSQPHSGKTTTKGKNMDLDAAIGKHAEWKTKFRNAITKQEQLDAATIAKDNCCDLGKWLHGEGKSMHSGLPSFAGCIQKHAAFHTEAGKVAAAINAKKYAEAQAMNEGGTPYAQVSGAVGVAIMALKREAKL